MFRQALPSFGSLFLVAGCSPSFFSVVSDVAICVCVAFCLLQAASDCVARCLLLCIGCLWLLAALCSLSVTFCWLPRGGCCVLHIVCCMWLLRDTYGYRQRAHMHKRKLCCKYTHARICVHTCTHVEFAMTDLIFMWIRACMSGRGPGFLMKALVNESHSHASSLNPKQPAVSSEFVSGLHMSVAAYAHRQHACNHKLPAAGCKLIAVDIRLRRGSAGSSQESAALGSAKAAVACACTYVSSVCDARNFALASMWTFMYVHICIYACVPACAYTSVHVYMVGCVHLRMCAGGSYARPGLHVHTFACMYACMRA